MDGARGHDVKRNKVGVEKQIPHVLTYVWDLKELERRSDPRLGVVCRKGKMKPWLMGPGVAQDKTDYTEGFVLHTGNYSSQSLSEIVKIANRENVTHCNTNNSSAVWGNSHASDPDLITAYTCIRVSHHNTQSKRFLKDDL